MDHKLKFNIGDYVANDYCFGKVIEVTDDAYLLDTGQGIPFSCEHNAHIWTITDAKDGDVLANEQGIIVMFQSMCSVGNANVYCCIENGEFIARNIGVFETENFHPATIEQTELMLSKMKESGYELDDEKKELKPITKPRFNVGDWIIDNLGFVWKIESIEQNLYHICDSEGVESLPDIDWVNNHFRLWSITDAKDGDVLANKNGAIFINAGSSNGGGTLDCYCYLSVQNEFCIEEHKTGSWLYKDDIKPATKEQRDILIQKMHEAGYEWDEEKKEIKNVKMESEIIEKFIVGKWYTCVKDFFGKGVHFDKGTAYYCAKEGCLQNEYGCHIAIVDSLYDNFKLWSISDANEGDVLVHNGCTFIFMGIKDGVVQAIEENMLELASFGEPDKDNDYQPATKEQRALIFQKITEAGYAWNPEKNKIEKIDETHDENTIQPKFKSGDVIVHKLSMKMGSTSWVSGKIEKVEDDKYILTDGSYFFIKEQDEWELSEHMPTENTINPKFKAGDHIVHSTWKDIYPYSSCGTIKEVKDDRYIFEDGSYIKICDQDLWELSKNDDCASKSSNTGLRYALSILEQSLGYVPGYQTNDGILKHKQAIAAVKNALKQKSSQPN